MVVSNIPPSPDIFTSHFYEAIKCYKAKHPSLYIIYIMSVFSRGSTHAEAITCLFITIINIY